MEVRALVERLEAQLERCPQPADDDRPGYVHAAAPAPPAPVLKFARGAPIRIGSYCHGLMASVLAKLKRAEQQAFYRAPSPSDSAIETRARL
jgi:hypothetical protein